MMRFEFATAGRIVFGCGSVRDAGRLAREYGARALVVTGSNPGRAEPLLASFRDAGIDCTLYRVSQEPDLNCVNQGVDLAQRSGCELIAGIGGGSVLDAGKAIAAILGNGGELLDYLEVVGRGKPLTKPSKPFLAVPTTAGTGSEATRNAVLFSPAHRVKVSLRGAFLLPTFAIVDPALTTGLPPEATANSGMDAITQLVEAFVCIRTNPVTDALCADALHRAAGALRQAFSNPDDLAARTDMSYAALISGIGLANAGLGAVHGFASPLGGMFNAPHGAICAALLPHVMAANIAALRQPARQSRAVDTIARYEQVARILTGNPGAQPEAATAWLAQLASELRIRPLSAYGMRPEHTAEAVEKAARANSMKANPVALTAAELEAIFRAAL